MIEVDERPLNVKYYFPRDTYREFRKVLFANDLTAQEFFFFLAYLVVMGDTRLMNLIYEAKKLKLDGKLHSFKTLVRTNVAAIYHMINERSRFK